MYEDFMYNVTYIRNFSSLNRLS